MRCLQNMKAEIRKATPFDASFIAWGVLTALDIPEDEMPEVEHICYDDHTLYSWKNSYIAEVDGKMAGVLVGYPGKDYVAMRDYTWIRMWPGITEEKIVNSPLETVDGEYYIDSLAVRPEFRGMEIGRQLAEYAIREAAFEGYPQVRLLCDIRKTSLISYYESIGFSSKGTMMFMGHPFYIMICSTPTNLRGSRKKKSATPAPKRRVAPTKHVLA